MCVCVCVCVCVYVCVCVCWTAGTKMVIEDRHTRRQYVACVIGIKLVKTACTHSLCRHVIGVVCSSGWCLCVCKIVHIQVCVAHP